jgi:hypothetical protein
MTDRISPVVVKLDGCVWIDEGTDLCFISDAERKAALTMDNVVPWNLIHVRDEDGGSVYRRYRNVQVIDPLVLRSEGPMKVAHTWRAPSGAMRRVESANPRSVFDLLDVEPQPAFRSF